MGRLARARDTHLTQRETAVAALVQFDAGETAPSIRQLAAALHVAPTAIYHHFPSRAAIYQAAIDLVWEEAIGDFADLVPDPATADPLDVLLGAAVATRRAFLRHHCIAPYVAATPASTDAMRNVLGLVAGLLERLGLEGDDAARCFHAYASLSLGATIFAAQRQIANDELARHPGPDGRTTVGAQPGPSASPTRQAMDGVIGLSSSDPERDEALFADGLRRLVSSFTG